MVDWKEKRSWDEGDQAQDEEINESLEEGILPGDLRRYESICRLGNESSSRPFHLFGSGLADSGGDPYVSYGPSMLCVLKLEVWKDGGGEMLCRWDGRKGQVNDRIDGK